MRERLGVKRGTICFVLSERVLTGKYKNKFISEQARQLSGVPNGNQIYIYIYIYLYMQPHFCYVKWEELSASHFCHLAYAYHLC